MRDEFYVTLDEDDMTEVYRPAPRPRRLSVLLLVLALMLAFLVVALLARYPNARFAMMESPMAIGLLGAIILSGATVTVLLVAAPALRRRAARSTLDDHPGMRDPICYAFDEQEFGITSTYTEARYPWRELWDWRETERVLVVMPTPRNFYVLPKRYVDAAVLERLRECLMLARKRRTAL